MTVQKVTRNKHKRLTCHAIGSHTLIILIAVILKCNISKSKLYILHQQLPKYRINQIKNRKEHTRNWEFVKVLKAPYYCVSCNT